MKWMPVFVLALGLFCVDPAQFQAGPPTKGLPVSRRESARQPELQARDDARRVAARIDEFINAGYVKNKVKPAPLADDAAFLRRLSLDISGRIPVVNEIRKFLREPSPEKRADAIDRLLDSPGYVNHFTSIWLELLIPEASSDFNRRFLLPSMHYWLRGHFADNTPYNKMVHELISLPMGQNNNTQMAYGYPGRNVSNPNSFYLAKQGKPEELAASMSRLFMGVRLECAQCHDHPFGKWKRDEFWSQAAFFAGIKGRGENFFFGPLNEVSDRREISIPNTDRIAQAQFLDGKMPRWKFKVSARKTLADWMTTKENPFFARAMVNRMWAHFFGIGLVDPIDDLVEDNPASHPELLAYLAKEFGEHDFDIKFLIRAITMSRTYQLSSVVDGSPADPRLYTRMLVKGLTGEQLFESLCVATGVRDNTNFQQRLYTQGTPRQNFLDKFADQDKRTEYYTSIPQALTMMNNQLINDATNPDRSEILGAVVSASFMTTSGKIEALFLASLSRKPTREEADRFLRYVEKGGASKDEKKALSDVFWALLNSTEFKFNH